MFLINYILEISLSLLKEWAKYGGIGGMSLIVVLYIFKGISSKHIINNLPDKDKRPVLKVIMFIVGIITLTSIIGYFILESKKIDNSNATFNLRLNLRDIKGQNVVPSIGKLILFIENKPEKVAVDVDGGSTFINIPSNYRNKKMRVELQVKGWQFLERTNYRDILIDSASKYLLIDRDSSLSQIKGQFITENGNPISDAEITYEHIKSRTNEKGIFILIVPPFLQKEEYTLYIQAKGYQPQFLDIRPSSKIWTKTLTKHGE